MHLDFYVSWIFFFIKIFNFGCSNAEKMDHKLFSETDSSSYTVGSVVTTDQCEINIVCVCVF